MITDIFHQFRKFIFVGMTNTFIDFSILNILMYESGFYDGSFVRTLDENHVKFAIVAKTSKPLKRLFLNARYQKIDDQFSTSEFSYQPGQWKKPYRYVVLRRTVDPEDDGLTLFTVHTDNMHTLKFPRNSPNKDVFEFALKKIMRLECLV